MSPERLLTRHLVRRRFAAFGGSPCEIILGDPEGETEIDSLLTEVAEFQRILTRFEPSSELSRFNARCGERVAVSPLLEEMLRVALDAAVLSEGLVNAGVGSAVIRAGYDRTFVEIGEPLIRAHAGPVPDLRELLEVGDGWAWLRPGWTIDLGGVGKGWLADRLCERYENACVNLGGDLRVRGGADGGGWTVGLCDGTVVTVAGGGVATSGTTSRRWRGGHHLIDPRSGATSDTGLAEVSVIAADALTAEILAKSALLLGGHRAEDWFSKRGAIGHAFVEAPHEC